jgi:RNA recognition motif-containing protein
MGSKIVVRGLPCSTDGQQLVALFATHGTVASAQVITDKFTGRSRGFGFVEMATSKESIKAIAALNGTELGGRTLTVEIWLFTTPQGEFFRSNKFRDRIWKGIVNLSQFWLRRRRELGS